MIITCPECATRYDLEEDRFLPNGRSVRCTSCGESWFVPAPEPIDALAALEPAARRDADPRDRHASESRARADHRADHRADNRAENRNGRGDDEPDADDRRAADDADIDVDGDLLPPRDEKGRFMARKAPREETDQGGLSERRAAHADYDEFEDDADFDDDEDDTLFDSPIAQATRKAKAAHEMRARQAREEQREAPPKGWRMGKQFFVEDDGDDERRSDPRDQGSPAFSKKRDRTEAEPLRAERRADQSHARGSGLRFTDRTRADERYTDEYDNAGDYADARTRESRYRDDEADDDIIPGAATIVDADFEDVDGEPEFGPAKGFGRRVREERRRSTAVARMEDVRRFDPQMFDEEFFSALRVTPRELEHAVRKARRRAESRDKNRLTPWRAFGWSAWVAAIAGAAYAVVVYRDDIVRAAPSAADAYAVVGIEVDPYGLKIENVRHRLAMSTGGPIIEITGVLRNTGVDAQNAPLLQAEALGPRGELMSRWTFSPEAASIAGNGVVEFMTRNPAPDGVAEVALSFAPNESAVSALRKEPRD
ncbi:MAG: zinc-ribbon domain-containing protein [Pseudomonadota bacterium]